MNSDPHAKRWPSSSLDMAPFANASETSFRLANGAMPKRTEPEHHKRGDDDHGGDAESC